MSHRFTAFMQDPDAPRPDNPIHSTEGGKAYGFDGALVGGIHVYGWTSDCFVDVLGEGWLSDGWADVNFRRPIYHGDAMEVRIEDGRHFETCKASSGEVCLRGEIGTGQAPWLGELTRTAYAAGGLHDEVARTDLTLANAPVGKPLAPLAIALSATESEEFLPYPADPRPVRYGAQTGLLHPAWIAGQMIGLLRKTYRYGPAVHARSQIQHLAQGYCGGPLSMTGHCVEAYERKGHHYIVNDGSLWDGSKEVELARLRHTAIFRVRPAE